MRISVNLASNPYVELGPVYTRLRIWTVILVIVGLALYYLYRSESTQAASTLANVHNVESQVRQLENQRQSYQALMQQPKDATILRQSDFLNGAFKRKAFSWTATMTDLETVLPSGVQVQSIDPIISPDGHVTIRLRVTGPREKSLDLIRNLERSKHFAAPRLVTESLATGTGNVQNISTGNDVNFDINADYRPLPLPANGPTEKHPARRGKRPATPLGAAVPGARPAGPAAPGPRQAETRGARPRGATTPGARPAGAPTAGGRPHP